MRARLMPKILLTAALLFWTGAVSAQFIPNSDTIVVATHYHGLPQDAAAAPSLAFWGFLALAVALALAAVWKLRKKIPKTA